MILISLIIAVMALALMYYMAKKFKHSDGDEYKWHYGVSLVMFIVIVIWHNEYILMDDNPLKYIEILAAYAYILFASIRDFVRKSHTRMTYFWLIFSVMIITVNVINLYGLYV